MTKKYTILVEKDQDGWLVSDVVGLPGCHTQAKTMDELIVRTKEAIRAYLADEMSDIVEADFIGVRHIEV